MNNTIMTIKCVFVEADFPAVYGPPDPSLPKNAIFVVDHPIGTLSFAIPVNPPVAEQLQPGEFYEIAIGPAA